MYWFSLCSIWTCRLFPCVASPTRIIVAAVEEAGSLPSDFRKTGRSVCGRLCQKIKMRLSPVTNVKIAVKFGAIGLINSIDWHLRRAISSVRGWPMLQTHLDIFSRTDWRNWIFSMDDWKSVSDTPNLNKGYVKFWKSLRRLFAHFGIRTGLITGEQLINSIWSVRNSVTMEWLPLVIDLVFRW